MRRWLALLLLAWPVVAAARAEVTTHEVAVRDDYFDPATRTVAVDDMVRWTKEGQKAHTVTWDDGSGRSTLMGPYTRQFTAAGTYRYHCELHESMTGTVVVQAAGPSSTSSSSTTTTLRRSVSTTTTTTNASLATAPPSTTTTSSSTTTTTLLDEPTTTSVDEAATGGPAGGDLAGADRSGDDIDLPGAVAAFLLLLTAGATLLRTRGGLG